MSRKPFRLKLLDRRKILKGSISKSFYDLNTVIHTGPEGDDRFDLIERSIGLEIDYGALMAYLFRRFGYPNSGWDDYKELACYQLSTPVPDMYMRVTPFVGNTAGISFMFMVAGEGWQAIQDYERKPGKDYAFRMHAWIESTFGTPAWSDACLQAVRRDWGAGIETWQEAFPYLEFYERASGSAAVGREDEGIPVEWIVWASEGRTAYQAIEARPGPMYRPGDIANWPEADPLKRYALAVGPALVDLKTAVRVRDSAINAFGRADDARTILKEPPVAGYPCGAIGNAAPEEFAQLHQLIMTMGKGDSKRGINKILKALGGT